MPPRIRCQLLALSSPSSSSAMCFSTSAPYNYRRAIFPHNKKMKPSSSIDASTNDPFKWSNVVPSIGSSANDPYKWKNPVPTIANRLTPISNEAWDINKEQNALNQLRITPVDIDPNQQPDEAEEARLTAWNREHGAPPQKGMSNRDRQLEKRFSFPLAEGQLYTSFDLSFQAWEQRMKVRDAVRDDIPDPFKRIGVDPFWEYKNWALLSNFVSSMGRILPASRTGCSAKNQRKLSKAIRRARSLGFMPIWSRHPLVQQTHKLTLQDHEEIVRQRIFKDDNNNEFLARVQQTIAR